MLPIVFIFYIFLSAEIYPRILIIATNCCGKMTQNIIFLRPCSSAHFYSIIYVSKMCIKRQVRE
ncbi:MAG: hypothetical protein EGQ01_15495 [Ruminococcaceae bacterium]|nr:hypothetical protein [Oscillospiraceae bacterium]MBD9212389.1 hypothetical protein [Oscillospiraceae bacterium]